MNYHQIWNTFSYALNGFVFVVLGFMIPTVVIDIFQTEPDNFSFLIVITILSLLQFMHVDLFGFISGTKIFISRKIYNLI